MVKPILNSSSRLSEGPHFWISYLFPSCVDVHSRSSRCHHRFYMLCRSLAYRHKGPWAIAVTLAEFPLDGGKEVNWCLDFVCFDINNIYIIRHACEHIYLHDINKGLQWLLICVHIDSTWPRSYTTSSSLASGLKSGSLKVQNSPHRWAFLLMDCKA